MDRAKLKLLRKQNEETREILVAAFPNCFCGRGEPKRPLKIGIFHDICGMGSDISKNRLRKALRDYTSGPLYLRAMVKGAPRLDLDGNEAGFVTEEQAEFAAWQLEKINAAIAARKIKLAA